MQIMASEVVNKIKPMPVILTFHKGTGSIPLLIAILPIMLLPMCLQVPGTLPHMWEIQMKLLALGLCLALNPIQRSFLGNKPVNERPLSLHFIFELSNK